MEWIPDSTICTSFHGCRLTAAITRTTGAAAAATIPHCPGPHLPDDIGHASRVEGRDSRGHQVLIEELVATVEEAIGHSRVDIRVGQTAREDDTDGAGDTCHSTERGREGE